MFALALLGAVALVGQSRVGSPRAATSPRASIAAAAVGAGPTGYVLPGEVDEDFLLSQSTFPIKPPALIELTKRLYGECKVGLADESVLADTFQFCAPFVGPLEKTPYLAALRNFKIEDAFPDTNPQYHGFRVDPFEPNRVWFNIRVKATHTGETKAFGKATSKALVFPPQAHSVVFNAEGKVTEMTVGYPVDRRVGNTGGLGGAFGYFYGIGRPLPIPECKPYARSLQFRALNLIGRIFSRN
ncbi:hypothetical protein T492DRAFT_1107531 [Pavlovales sp. CCMP2436]|nr:hypothetical protein T492DRAFT_1107531 [Pavlovales sp. CCMP2436]